MEAAVAIIAVPGGAARRKNQCLLEEHNYSALE